MLPRYGSFDTGSSLLSMLRSGALIAFTSPLFWGMGASTSASPRLLTGVYPSYHKKVVLETEKNTLNLEDFHENRIPSWM